MTAKEIAVKKYVVRLSAAERERLETLLRSGKHPAQKLTKARILLKADVGEAGEGWSDSQIAKALDTSLATIARTRQQLVEEGFDAVADPQALAQFGQKAHLRWRRGSQTHRADPFGAAKRPRTMDVEPVGGQGRGAEHCRQGQR